MLAQIYVFIFNTTLHTTIYFKRLIIVILNEMSDIFNWRIFFTELRHRSMNCKGIMSQSAAVFWANSIHTTTTTVPVHDRVCAVKACEIRDQHQLHQQHRWQSRSIQTRVWPPLSRHSHECEYVGAVGPPLLKTCRLRPHCAPSIHHTGGRQPSQRRPLLCGKIRCSHPNPAHTCSLF